MKITYFIFIILMLIFFTQLFSIDKSGRTISLQIPDSTQVQILTVEEGTSFIGRIIEIGEEKLKFETKQGVLIFSIFEITELKLVSEDQFKEGKTELSQVKAKNAVYLELVGNGGIISANYDRFLTQNVGLRIGVGSLLSSFGEVTFPVMVNYNIGKDYRFEIGVGLLHIPDGKWDGTLPCVNIGYRYQSIEGGNVFRIGFTPFLGEGDEIFFWGWAKYWLCFLKEKFKNEKNLVHCAALRNRNYENTG